MTTEHFVAFWGLVLFTGTLLVVVFVTNCDTRPQTAVKEVVGSSLDRIADDKYKVVCWKTGDRYGVALHCLPEDQLKLREVRR